MMMVVVEVVAVMLMRHHDGLLHIESNTQESATLCPFLSYSLMLYDDHEKKVYLLTLVGDDDVVKR